MFFAWANSKLPYSKKSNSISEREKLTNNWIVVLVSLSEFYCLPMESG